MPSLLDMTNLPMANILNQCDFQSVLRLRKVCHSLRNFIDVANLQTDLKEIVIYIDRPNYSQVIIKSAASERKFPLESDLSKKDLETVLKLQNSTLSTFVVWLGVEKPQFLYELAEILEKKPRPLQTEKLLLNVSNGTEVLKILPKLNSNVLKRVHIDGVECKGKNLVPMDNILDSEQFKNSINFTVTGFAIKADLKKFFHFEKIRVKFVWIPLRDVAALKETFITSTQMKCFWLEGYDMENYNIEEVFGEPSHVIPANNPLLAKKYWFFKLQKSKNLVLEIKYDGASQNLIFRKKISKKLPEFLIVRD